MIHTPVEQPLPVVRVGEIQSQENAQRLACGGALGCVVRRRDRWCPQVRQDLAGAGHGLERGDRHGVPGQVRRAGAGAGLGLPGRGRTAGRA